MLVVAGEISWLFPDCAGQFTTDLRSRSLRPDRMDGASFVPTLAGTILRWIVPRLECQHLAEMLGGYFRVSIFTNFDHLNREMFTVFDRDFRGH